MMDSFVVSYDCQMTFSLTRVFTTTSRPTRVIHARTSVVVDGPQGQGGADADEIFID